MPSKKPPPKIPYGIHQLGIEDTFGLSEKFDETMEFASLYKTLERPVPLLPNIDDNGRKLDRVLMNVNKLQVDSNDEVISGSFIGCHEFSELRQVLLKRYEDYESESRKGGEELESVFKYQQLISGNNINSLLSSSDDGSKSLEQTKAETGLYINDMIHEIVESVMEKTKDKNEEK
ncbi:hypothetical protein SNEBB_005956 [Seison nebaliae]|nr:hypothetical protein SNEBB_005956 [Seison nebaliae]